jgi:hypothetical protein
MDEQSHSLVPKKAQQAIEKVISEKSSFLRLARLELSDADVQDIDWSRLDFVKNLDLSGNALRTFPTKIVFQIPRLQELSIYKNQISEIPPRIMPFWRELHTLLISDNNLKSIPADFCRGRHLRVLDLSSNKFTSIPAALGASKSLEQCNLAGNLLTSEEKRKVEAGLMEYLQELPEMGLLGLGNLLNEETGDDKVSISCCEGVVVKHLHKFIVNREPLFRSRKVIGDGQFTLMAWEMVIQFLYSGSVRITEEKLWEELAELVLHHRIESMISGIEQAREEAALQKPEEEGEGEEKEGGEGEGEGDAAVPEKKEEEFQEVFLEDFNSLSGHLRYCLEEELFCDFEIECADGETIRCIFAVLANRTDHFQAMSRNICRENCEKRVVMKDFSSSTMKSILEFAYLGTVGQVYEVELVSLLEAANFMQIQELILETQSLLGENLSLQNAAFLLTLSDFLTQNLLFSLSLEYLKTNWHAVARKDFNQLPSHLQTKVCRG